MDEKFEKVVDEFLEIEPLNFIETEEFYKKYKSYLENNIPTQINDFEEYRLIIANIGSAYFSVKKCDEAIPLFKKAIKLGDERDSTRQNLIISYFSKKKYLSAYYYYIRYKPKSDMRVFKDAMKVAKQATVYKLFVWFLYSGIAFYVITMTYEFFYDDIEGVWDNVMKSIYIIVVMVFTLKYFAKGKN
jgi:tetratricopeptide (TPR) repeat protein